MRFSRPSPGTALGALALFVALAGTSDPGLGVPAGGSISAQIHGSVSAEAYIDGYLAKVGSVPAAPATATGAPNQQQRR